MGQKRAKYTILQKISWSNGCAQTIEMCPVLAYCRPLWLREVTKCLEIGRGWRQECIKDGSKKGLEKKMVDHSGCISQLNAPILSPFRAIALAFKP